MSTPAALSVPDGLADGAFTGHNPHPPVEKERRVPRGVLFWEPVIRERSAKSASRIRGWRLDVGGQVRITARVFSVARPFLSRHPSLKAFVIRSRGAADLMRHSVASAVPRVIRAAPQSVFVTLTADCNQRCVGCRYGRDFMPGSELPLPVVRSLLDDCKQVGIFDVRLYGGEPLLHRDLPDIVDYSVRLGLRTWMTTNGVLLRQKVDRLYEAGLRHISVGLYGTGHDYDTYVQRKGLFARLEESLAYTRDRYGFDVKLDFAWLLMRPTCSPEAIQAAWSMAERYSMPLAVNLIHYSLPYFTEGPNRELQFRPEDRPRIEAAVAQLLALKKSRPDLLLQSDVSLRSIPDWLLKGPGMAVPCDRYRLIWVGADGTVQMCYVTFQLGNLHEKRLKNMLFTAEHQDFARKGFKLDCPNCHCAYTTRVETHLPSLLRYAGQSH